MGIFGRIRNYFDTRRRGRLESDLQVISQKKTQFNPTHFRNLDYLDPEREFTLSVQENLLWFQGKARTLSSFYSTFPDYTTNLNYFWATAPANYRKVHSGMPKNIAVKMATILFGNGFTNEITIYKTNEDGTISDVVDEKASAQATDTLEILKDKVDLMSKIENAATTESWSGHVFFKFTINTELSQYPILEIADLRNAGVEKEQGITTKIIFKNYYNQRDKLYVHKEYHYLNEKEEPVIGNELFEIKQSGEVLVNLGTIAQTKGLLPEFTFTGLKGWIAFEKPNKLPNNDFLDSHYGASDFAGAHSSFDALDETLSEIYAEIRNNKTIRYIPETMLKYSGTGDRVAILDAFITNYVKVAGSLEQNAKNEINITQIDDKHESLYSKWKIGVNTVATNAGVNPIALGITGLESIDASEGSQQERNKTTIDTRKKKLRTWRPFLEELELQLLALNSWMQKNYNLEQKGLNRNEIDFANCSINVNFGDYVVNTQEEKLNTWGSALQLGVVSLDTAIEQIWKDDWDESQIQEEINRKKYENGMTLDNPNNLPELTGFEDEADEIEQLQEDE